MGFYELTEAELLSFKKILQLHSITIINFIYKAGDSKEGLTIIKELIEHLPNELTNQLLKSAMIDKKFRENIYPLIGSKALEDEEKVSNLMNCYSVFYMQFPMEKLLYFYRNCNKMEKFDRILLELFIYKINNCEYAYVTDATSRVLKECLNFLDNYDTNMPLDWFIEFNRLKLEELFALVLRS